MRFEVGPVDVSRPLGSMSKARQAALGITAENVLSDCRPMVPLDRGDLRASGKTKVDGEAGYVMWGTDTHTARYARVQYYKPLHHTTPGTCDHWFDRTRSTRESAWERMYAQEYGRRLK